MEARQSLDRGVSILGLSGMLGLNGDKARRGMVPNAIGSVMLPESIERC